MHTHLDDIHSATTMYTSAKHEEMTGVSPLLQLFELVHIGTVACVPLFTYLSSSLNFFFASQVPHIDCTDFLNGIVCEKTF